MVAGSNPSLVDRLEEYILTDEMGRRPWTVDDVLGVKALTEVGISPDGAVIAYTVRAVYKEDTQVPKSSIWVVDTSGGGARQFTSGPRADRTPHWSPDSQTLAFLSDRDEDGRFDIYTLSRSGGGEAHRLADLKGSVTDLQWSPDGRQIAFLMTDPETEEEKQRKKEKDDAIEFERDPRYQRLWVVGADGSDPRVVSAVDVQVWEFAWFPDGRSFALICSELPHEWSWYECYVGTIPLSGGDVTPTYRSERQVAAPLPSPDGRSVAFISAYWSDCGVVGGDVYTIPSGGGEARCLTSGYPVSFSWVEWSDAGSMLAIGYDEGEAAIYRLDIQTESIRLWSGEAMLADRHWARASLTGDGSTLAIIREDPSAPADIWTAIIPGGGDAVDNLTWNRLTHMQPQLDVLTTGDPRTLRWQAPDGTPVQGILLRPAGYEEGRSYPLVTIVHGGPTGMYHHGFITSHPWAPLLVSNGFAVLLPNPRGSTGWGAEFAEANLGDMGGRDLADILAGVDAAVQSGVADPERLGIGGWSYGGFMTAWTITQTDRFKAAIMGAGIANWHSFHGVSNVPTWDRLFYSGANPHSLSGPFADFSAIFQVDRVRTPTLILHGEQDPCVPVGQGYEFFRALKDCGVETEMVVYPREGHGLSEKAHLRHLQERAIGWYRSHLNAQE